MKTVKLLSVLAGAVALLPLGISAGTVTVTSGPNFTPPDAFTLNTIQVDDSDPATAKIFGDATITPPASNSASIDLSGFYTAEATDIASVAYTFVVDSNVTGNTTFELKGSATILGIPQEFSTTGTILPGKHVYRGEFEAPITFPIPTSGTFSATVTFNFNAAAAGARAQTAPSPLSAAPGTLALSIPLIAFQVAQTAATAPPPSQLVNISTRLGIETGENVLIGGFIVTGTDPKQVVIRGLGPSVQLVGTATGVLADPVLELHKPDGTVVTNDNWMDNSAADQMVLTDNNLDPSDDLESALVVTLDPGEYTAIVRGSNDGTGVGMVEVYDLDTTVDSQLANISTRGFVRSGEQVMIGGFILGPDTAGVSSIVVRAIGPSLVRFGVDTPLADPTLELHNADGDVVASNDNWMDSPDAQTISDFGLAPTADAESALLVVPQPSTLTAVVDSADGSTGVALVEVFNMQRR